MSHQVNTRASSDTRITAIRAIYNIPLDVKFNPEPALLPAPVPTVVPLAPDVVASADPPPAPPWAINVGYPG